MSKDLLKEAIADAKAVRETAIANAKLALEEAFTPKIQSMLSTKIREDFEDELEDDVEDGIEDVAVEDEFAAEAPLEDEAELEIEDELEVEGDVEAELGLEDDEDDLELEAIIKELENEEEEVEAPAEEFDAPVAVEDEVEEEDFDLDEVIKSLQEDDEEEVEAEEQSDLDEAYETIKFLKDKINEVNLLNAKLLFSNKLFRTNNLDESQKLRVIETFDRADSVREVKLIYSTLAESMKGSKNPKKTMTEGLASKVTKSTAPAKSVIVENNQFSDRMRKLAGLI